MTVNPNSSPGKSIGSWIRRAAMDGLRFVSRSMRDVLSLAWSVAALLVLLLYVSLDFLPKFGSKPLTSPIPNPPRHPHLRRNGSNVFWEMPGGEIIPLDGLEASQVLQEVAETVGGAFCYEKTRIRVDESR